MDLEIGRKLIVPILPLFFSNYDHYDLEIACRIILLCDRGKICLILLIGTMQANNGIHQFYIVLRIVFLRSYVMLEERYELQQIRGQIQCNIFHIIHTISDCYKLRIYKASIYASTQNCTPSIGSTSNGVCSGDKELKSHFKFP